MSVHSRTVIVLWKKRLSIVLFCTTVGFHPGSSRLDFSFCLRLVESSAQSSSQSEDDDEEFFKMHMSDRRRWQDGGSAVS